MAFDGPILLDGRLEGSEIRWGYRMSRHAAVLDISDAEMRDLTSANTGRKWAEGGHEWSAFSRKVDSERVALLACPQRSRDKERAIEKKSVSDQLIEIAQSRADEFFHDQLGEAYCRIRIEDHYENWRISSKAFKSWLDYEHFAVNGSSVNRESLNQAVRTLESIAVHRGPLRTISLRICWHEGAIWYDLADSKWRAVRIHPSIKPHGWEIIDSPPPLFRRHQHMAAQVEPQPGGNFDGLFSLMNFSPEERPLFEAWLVSLFNPRLPSPIVDFTGRKGGAKSDSAEAIKMTVDPSTSWRHTWSNPRVSLNNLLDQNYLLVFDNESQIPRWVADKLCKAIYGETDQERELYQNKESVLYEYQRKIIITSVEPLGLDFSDFVQRTMYPEFPFIPEDRRITKEEVSKRFKAELPLALGYVFSILAKAMEIKDGISLQSLPRMADFCIWGEAISRAMGQEPGLFSNLYLSSTKQGSRDVVEANPLAQAIIRLLDEKVDDGGNLPYEGADESSLNLSPRDQYLGRSEPLYNELKRIAQKAGLNTKNDNWPGGSNVLSRKIPSFIDDLREVGIRAEKRHWADIYKHFSKPKDQYNASDKLWFIARTDNALWKDFPAPSNGSDASSNGSVNGSKPGTVQKSQQARITALNGSNGSEGGSVRGGDRGDLPKRAV